MKRKWGKAIIEVQRFVAQEYCVVCDPNEYHTGNDREIYKLVFIPGIYLRYDNPPHDGKFQWSESLNTTSTNALPNPNALSYNSLQIIKIDHDLYERIGSGETAGKSYKDKTLYREYSEAVYIPRAGYAYKAEKISS